MNKNDHGKVCFLDPTGMPTAHFKPMVFDRVEYIEKNIVEALTERQIVSETIGLRLKKFLSDMTIEL